MPVVIGAKPESNFANPIGLLGDCHRRIERFLNVLLRLAEQAGRQTLSWDQCSALDTALRYFREAAPKHTADEEESLFPRLRQMDNPEVRSLLARVDSLEDDHVWAAGIHAEVDGLGKAWLQTGALWPEESRRLECLLAQLRDLYRRHIMIEDTEIFPFAAAALSASDRASIGAEMAARRGLTNSVR